MNVGVTPDDMLTEEEIQKLIGVCENSKERALIACIFDAALKIEEAGYLRWRQIQKLWHSTINKNSINRDLAPFQCGDPEEMVRHFCWRNERIPILWTKKHWDETPVGVPPVSYVHPFTASGRCLPSSDRQRKDPVNCPT